MKKLSSYLTIISLHCDVTAKPSHLSIQSPTHPQLENFKHPLLLSVNPVQINLQNAVPHHHIKPLTLKKKNNHIYEKAIYKSKLYKRSFRMNYCNSDLGKTHLSSLRGVKRKQEKQRKANRSCSSTSLWFGKEKAAKSPPGAHVFL